MTDSPVVPTRRRRTWAIVGIAALALLAGVAALATVLIDTDAVKLKIEQRVSTAIGGEASYESMALGLLPRPHASIHGLRFSVPAAVEGRVAVVDVQLALLPLVMGDVQLRQVRIEQPELTVQLPAGDSSDPWAAYRTTLAPVVDALVREARGLSLEVSGGTLDVIRDGQRIIALSALAGHAGVSADAVVVTVGATSNRWQSAHANFSVTPGTLEASAKLKFDGLDAGPVVAPLFSGSAFRMRPGPIDGNLDITTDGRSSVRGTLVGATPGVSIARADRRLDLGASGFTMDFNHDAGTLALALKDVRAGALLSGARGSLRTGAGGSAPALELQIADVDLHQAGDAALALFGDTAGVRAWIAPDSAGGMKNLQLRATSSDWASLWQLQSFHGEARLENFAYSFPAAGVAVKDGAGRIILADGRLQASELSGVVGKSSFRDAALAAQLSPVAVLERLSGTVDADLGETLILFRHRGRRAGVVLPVIESLHGRATGSVAYQVRRGKPHLAVKAATLKADARLRGVPFPLELSEGKVDYTDDRLAVRGLAGRAGRSRLRGVAAEFLFGAAPAVRAASGSFSLAFDELYPWLASLDALREPLQGLSAVAGDAEVDLKRLSGPLKQPQALDFEAAVRPKNLRISGNALPGVLRLASGEVGVTPQNMQFERLAASLLDAEAVLSGTVHDYAVPARNLQLILSDGAAGPQSLKWAYARWKLPQRLMLRAPVALPSGRLEWKGGESGTLLAQGNAGLAGGAQAGFDVSWQPGNLDLRRLTLKDADSDATVAFRREPAAVDAAFRGRLSNRSIDRMLAHAPPARGSVQGDFQAVINLREPQRSTATGKLEGEGIDIFERWGIPLVIDRFGMEEAGDALHLRDANIQFSGQAIKLAGSVSRANERFALDVSATADKVDVEKILRAFQRGDAGPRGGAWNLPVAGKVAITAGSLTYGAHGLQQVAAEVLLAPNRIVAEATEARLCDVAMPFRAVLVPGSVEISAKPAARGAALGPAISCLAGKHLAVSGTYDLEAELSAGGKPDALLQTLHGKFNFAARAGKIGRAEALNRTLALDEVAGRMGADPAPAMQRGYDYDEITAAGTVHSGRVHLDRATLDSPSLGITVAGEIGLADRNLALQGLVAPLDKLSRVAKGVPIVGGVFGTSIVVVPVSIRGDIRDPQVRVLEAAAVGATLVNLMKATFKAPIQLLDFGSRSGTPSEPGKE